MSVPGEATDGRQQPVPVQPPPSLQPPLPPASVSTTATGTLPAAAASSTTSTPAPTPAASGTGGSTGSNKHPTSPKRGSSPPAVPQDLARKANAIKLLEKDYGTERYEFQFVKTRKLGVIVEDIKEVTVVVDFKREECGTLCLCS